MKENFSERLKKTNLKKKDFDEKLRNVKVGLSLYKKFVFSASVKAFYK